MKIVSLSLLFIVFSLSSFGQKSLSLLLNLNQANNNYTYNQLTSRQNVSPIPIIKPTNDQIGLSARSRMKKGNFFEILAAARYSNREISNQTHSSGQILDAPLMFERKLVDLQARFEIGKSFSTSSLPQMHYGIGLALDPRLTYADFRALNSNSFSFTYLSYQAVIALVPQIEFNVNNRINVTVKMPLEFVAVNHIFGEQSDPSMTIMENMFTYKYMDAFRFKPTYTIGVGYFITHSDR